MYTRGHAGNIKMTERDAHWILIRSIALSILERQFNVWSVIPTLYLHQVVCRGRSGESNCASCEHGEVSLDDLARNNNFLLLDRRSMPPISQSFRVYRGCQYNSLNRNDNQKRRTGFMIPITQRFSFAQTSPANALVFESLEFLEACSRSSFDAQF